MVVKRKLGAGFADFVRENGGRRADLSVVGGGGSDRGGKYGKWRRRFLEPRVAPFFVVFVIGMGALLFRLFWLTMIRGGYYRSLSEENRVREEIVWAPRGIIYDRNGKALVLNRPVYRKRRKSKDKSRKYEYLTQEEMLELEAGGEAEDVELFVSREYPYGEIFAHVVGYVGEVDRADVKGGLQTGSLRGKAGLEESFDSVLRGTEGRILLETDAKGVKIGELGRIDGQPGEDLLTNLDAELQTTAAEALRGGKPEDRNGTSRGNGRPGAVVVSKPDTGEILVLYSSPSFNPNIFVAGPNEDEEAANGVATISLPELLRSSASPLFNRAIAGAYPPGSTFKIVTAAAGLEEGAIDANTTFEDKGFIAIGPYLFRNWYYTRYGKVEGKVDVVKGMARSTDTFFYKVGEKTGIENLAKWGSKFGLGEKLGIEIAGEAKGRMPDEEWKMRAKKERWYLGDTYHVSIGQGDVLATPLQVNFFTAAIANGGKLCGPKLVKSKERKARDSGRGSTGCRDLGLSEKSLALVKEGMRRACAPGGTGFQFFEFEVQSSRLKVDGINFIAESGDKIQIPVACKTGTAEFGDPDGNTHAWFTVFAPLEKPEIAVTVFLEGGGSGAYDAAPVAKEILTEYFGGVL